MLQDDAFSGVMAARADDPLRPVTFVVPSRLAALQGRRDLARHGPHAAVRFESLVRLAELTGAGELAAEGRRPLARPIGDYAARVVARESGGIFAGVADLPGYARVLRRHFQRLRRAGIRGSADVDGALRTPAAEELLRAYDAFRDLTVDFYDTEDLLDAAAQAVRYRRSGVATELGAVYVTPPGARSAAGAAFLEALEQAGTPVVHLSDPPRLNGSGSTIDLLPDPGSEADAVARRVIALLEGGAAFHEVAVFHGGDPAAPAMLSDALDRAGLPVARFPGRPLMETPAGRAALALLRLPAEDYARVAVSDFFALNQSPLEVPSASGPRRLRATTWDRMSRAAGVTHGLARWHNALSAFASDADERAADADEDFRREIARSEAAGANELLEVIQALTSSLERLRTEQPARAFIPALREAVETWIRPDADGLAEVLDEIDQLGTVDAIGGSFSLDGFLVAFEANLRLATQRTEDFGAGVLVAHYRAAAGLRFPHAIVTSAYEGVFPAVSSTEAVVDDRWWAALRENHPFAEDRAVIAEREREAAVRALASAFGTLAVFVPLSGPGGTADRYPAPAVAELATEMQGRPVTASALRTLSAEGIQRLRSPLGSVATGPVLDAFEHDLRAAILSARAGRAAIPRLARAVDLRAARRRTTLSEWDSLVEGVDGLLPEGRELSATAMEAYAACGFRFFGRTVLGIRAVEAPSEQQTMDPATRGTLVHAVLTRFFEEQKGRGRPAPGEEWTDDDRARLLEILDEALDAARERGQTGLEIYHAHERAILHADMEGFLEDDSRRRRESGSVPEAFEWSFRGLELAGHTLRGSVDRIDLIPGTGEALLIDYKTGKSDRYRIDEADPFKGGAQLQLGIYAAAVERDFDVSAARGRYWFVTRKGAFDTADLAPSPVIRGRLERIIETASAAIEQGVFPAVPGDEDWRGGWSNCGFCDFDRICSRRREALFARRSGHDAFPAWTLVGQVAQGLTDE